MTSIDVARQVVATKQCHLFRMRPDGSYDCKPFFSGNKRKWIALDLFSASALVQVYDAINDTNKANLAALPLVKAVALCFRVINKSAT